MTDQPVHDNPERKYEVTPVELLFDLVFAFALSQLSHHLLTHLLWRGTAETLVMLLAIFAVWFTTSWSATLVRADQSRTRWLVLAVMLLGLFMNASVTRAFTTSGWAFVVPLLDRWGCVAACWPCYARCFALCCIASCRCERIDPRGTCPIVMPDIMVVASIERSHSLLP